MATDPRDLSEREQRLDEILTAYLKAIDAGQIPDRQELVSRHPDLAAELMEFFLEQDQLDSWVEPLRPVVQAAQIEAAGLLKLDGSLHPTESAPPQGMVRCFGDYELLQE